MPGRLDGKIALITGACSGIGLATVKLFVSEGAKVVAADVQDAKGSMLQECFPGQVRYAHCDVMLEEDIKAAVDLASSAFGGLDILFNNAGRNGPRGPIEQTDAKAWDDTFVLLVRAAVMGMKHAVPLMKRRGGGAIVNTASIAGMQASSTGLAYSASKAAVMQLTKVSAAELSPQNIRVNAICPGFIATAIIGEAMGMSLESADQLAEKVATLGHKFQPVPKPGLPHDVAEVALFLASDAAAFISGTHIVVDGGLTIGPPSAWQPDPGASLLQALGMRPQPVASLAARPAEPSRHVE